MLDARRSALDVGADADALKKPRLQAATSESLQALGTSDADLKHKRSQSTRVAAAGESDLLSGTIGLYFKSSLNLLSPQIVLIVITNSE